MTGGEKKEVAVFGGGCFWCTEAVFGMLKGVVSALPGYAGGPRTSSGQAPTYEEVCTGETGQAEVIKVEFDPSEITYGDLLTVFFATHDPTTLNRQGNDVGTQYRSIILYTSEEQRKKAEEYIANLGGENGAPIVTEVKALDTFYGAEEYHKKYYEKNTAKPYCQVVISPKVEKVQEKFTQLLKTHSK